MKKKVLDKKGIYPLKLKRLVRRLILLCMESYKINGVKKHREWNI